MLGGTWKVNYQVGVSQVLGPEILGGTLNPPAHYGVVKEKSRVSFFKKCKIKKKFLIQ